MLEPIDEEDIIDEITWIKLSDITPSYGLNCCSESSVAFHYIAPPIMYEIDDFLYRCPRSVVRNSFRDHGEGYYSKDFKVVAQKKAIVTPH